ncbi:MAG: DNA internalization-related competence protein ComEC/Rec2 [Calditrichia bacterium]
MRFPTVTPLVIVTPVFACGIFAASVELRFAVVGLIVGICSVITLVSILTPRDRFFFKPTMLLLIVFLAGFFRFSIWQSESFLPLAVEHLPLQCDSVAAEIVSVRTGRRLSAVAELRAIWLEEDIFETSQTIQLYLPAGTGNLSPGDGVLLHKVQFEQPLSARNPGSFDYRQYLESRGIRIICDVRKQIQFRHFVGAPSLRSELANLRSSLAERLDLAFPPREASLLKALWLGQAKQLDSDIRKDFQRTGLVHVLAVSGLHVGFLLALLLALFKLLGFRGWARSILIIVSLLLFLLITGIQPAVTRAVIMGALWLVCRGLERSVHSQQILFLAAFIILLLWPQQLFWIGFQLSFMAVFWINFIYLRLQLAFENVLKLSPKSDALVRLAPSLAVSLAAQIGTAPLVAFYFGQLAPLSIVFNLAILPVVAFLVSAGPFVFLLQEVVYVGDLVNDLIGMLLRAKIDTVHRLSELPGVALDIQLTSVLQAVLVWLLLAVFFIRLPFRLRLWRPIAMIFVGIVVIHSHFPAVPVAQLIVLDVGQGEALVLRLRSGQTLLIDCGPANRYFNSGERIVLPTLKEIGIERLDKIFITHPHRDHTGGLSKLISTIPVDSLYLPPNGVDSNENGELKKLVGRYGIGSRTLKRGNWLELDRETRLYMLGPSPGILRREDLSSPINNRSLCFLIRHRSVSMLFTGDAEAVGEEALLGWEELLHSTVLKVGHHGSKTSATPALLKHVKPKYALISAGRKNRFRHPSPRTLQRLLDFDSKILRTDRHGAIWLEIHGDEIHPYFWR